MFWIGIVFGQTPERLGNLLGQGYQITASQPLPMDSAMFFIVQKGSSAYYCLVGDGNHFGPQTIAASACSLIPQNSKLN